ncbi:hypothetical protein [Pelagibacterium luteolum]|uniref:Uncharacterized protein n=1 Tax=Pelagibacterium luteolum TaxID=440168 RepID=A0A1G7ZPK6_9HYPH|nr:hypothetical protein [Pelagibacterium luteolum]SDH10579.1 hypothetical protein SAMN04487974_12155 [Pelagibacterium luteolum]
MLHTIENPDGVHDGRFYFNFASQVLRAGHREVLLIVEHPDEICLNLRSITLVLPELKRRYAGINFSETGILWASRYEQGTNEILDICWLDRVEGYTPLAWRYERIEESWICTNFRDTSALKISALRATRFCEKQLAEIPPYGGKL